MRTVMSISLPSKISEKLDQYAKETGRNKSDIVKESIRMYLWESRFAQIRKKLIIRGKKASMITEEDVFKIVS